MDDAAALLLLQRLSDLSICQIEMAESTLSLVRLDAELNERADLLAAVDRVRNRVGLAKTCLVASANEICSAIENAKER